MNVFCYPHFISDFRRDTGHLSHEQKGVYRDLIDAYYFNAGNLTSELEQLARIISVQTDSERSALAYAVATFFTTKTGKLVHKRADQELTKMRDKSCKASANAKSKSLKSIPIDTSESSLSAHTNAPANAQLITSLNHNSKLATAEKIFSEEEIKSAKRGTVEWTPISIAGEVLPGGWSDAAEQLGIPDSQIYTSWRKFKDHTGSPYELNRWKGWIKNEKGAVEKTQLEAAE